MNSKTLLIIKHHVILTGKHWNILIDIEKNNLQIDSFKRIFLNKEFYQKFYLHLSTQSFYDSLCTLYSVGDVLIVIVSGENAITRLRSLVGPTNPVDAIDNQIRHKYGKNVTLNAVHASENYNDYIKEIELIKLYENQLRRY